MEREREGGKERVTCYLMSCKIRSIQLVEGRVELTKPLVNTLWFPAMDWIGLGANSVHINDSIMLRWTDMHRQPNHIVKNLAGAWSTCKH